MPKRNLRIVRRVRNTPVLGVCEACNEQFSGDPNMGNAQSAIQRQFNSHTCKSEAAAAAAVPIMKEVAESKKPRSKK